MLTYFKFKKAVKNAFTMLVLAALVSVTENSSAGTDSLARYHISLAEKYGYNLPEVTVSQVIIPDRLNTIKEISERTRHQLIDFASSINADAFAYEGGNVFWRMNKGKRVLGYTFSIDILENDVKLFDYYCFAILEYREDRGFTMGCSAYHFAER